MKNMKRLRVRGLVLMMSILLTGAGSSLAETDEPGPFQNFFRHLRRAFNEPQHKSVHRSSSHKQTDDTKKSANEGSKPTSSPGGGLSAPPNERNTRSATRVSGKKGSDLRYGTPVPGKEGLVISPYSPNGGYIDVRGFAPGTPVKDPYSGKIFLTP